MHESRNTLQWSRLLSLRAGQAEPEVIDATIRDGIRIGGTNLWVLMFAILIASIGLNVNSTAVIIGAMLISPLMGPIIGAGYGAGIQDSRLIRQSLRNLAVFVFISLLTSTLYFLVTPLSHAQSELLARTTPTIWDVLIAFVGGAAGMVGLTRKEKTTVIPGVAIATALMPPLCTAGYGLANGELHFVLGAFYLFTINGVFIGMATLAITRVLRLPLHTFSNERARSRGRLVIAAAVTVTLLPSIYLAAQMVRDEFFNTQANRYLSALQVVQKDMVILSRDLDAKNRRIAVTVLGDITPELQRSFEYQLTSFRLADARLEIRSPKDAWHSADVARLKQELQQDVRRTALRGLEEKAARVTQLEAQISRMNVDEADYVRVEEEIRAQLPAIRRVTVARTPASGSGLRGVIVIVDAAHALPLGEIQRLERWLSVRLPKTEISVVLGKAVDRPSPHAQHSEKAKTP